MENTSVDIVSRLAVQWQEVCKRVNQAVVYIDDPSAECLSWAGGAGLLFKSGATTVKEFSLFESCSSEFKKAVFIVNGYISETTENALKSIIKTGKLQYVIVISNMPAAYHTMLRQGHVEEEEFVFQKLEDSLLMWMGNANFSSEVVYIPVIGAAITSNLFALPGQEHTLSLLPSQWHKVLEDQVDASNSSHTVQTLSQLPPDLHLQLKSFVYALNSLMEVLHVGEEVFSLGQTSRLVATELANLTVAKNRRKNAHRKASVVIVDRVLDLPSVIGHHSETCLDKLLQGLPRLDGHHSDVKIDMTPVWNSNMSVDSNVIAPGCLAHNYNMSSKDLLSTLATSKVKEGLMEVNRKVVELMSSEGISVELLGRPGRVTPDQIQTHLKTISSKPAAVLRNNELIQLGLACVQGLTNTSSSTCSNHLLAAEKGLVQAAGMEEGQGLSPVEQVLATLASHQQQQNSLHSVSDILGLLVMAFSLTAEAPSSHLLEQLKVHIVQLLTETPEEQLPQFIKDCVEDCELHDVVTDIVDDITAKLMSIPQSYKDLKQFNQVYSDGGVMGQTLQPLMKNLTQQMLENKEELVDLEYKSTGLRNLLKSGFGLFMNVNKPRPTDHPLVILVVMGGVTSQEHRLIQEAVAASKAKTQVLFGGTKLVTPQEAVEDIFSTRTTSV